MSDRQEYYDKVHKLTELLAKHDLMGLIKMGAPQDEYQSEAFWIMDDLQLPSDLQYSMHVVKCIFEESFGVCDKDMTEKLVQLDQEKLEEATKEIMELINHDQSE